MYGRNGQTADSLVWSAAVTPPDGGIEPGGERRPHGVRLQSERSGSVVLAGLAHERDVEHVEAEDHREPAGGRLLDEEHPAPARVGGEVGCREGEHPTVVGSRLLERSAGAPGD